MGATLSTLRKYIRAEVGDQEATEKLSTVTLTHDGGNGWWSEMLYGMSPTEDRWLPYS
jgi:hypothetical protein